MEKSILKRNKMRKSRVMRVRKKLRGMPDKPRLSISKTNKHLFVQLIDDENGKTLFGLGTCSKVLKESKFEKRSKESAEHLGKLVAKAAKEKKIDTVVFDRGRYKFHGIVALFAEAARKEGLTF